MLLETITKNPLQFGSAIMKAQDTIYIIGESRTNKDNAITIMYHSFYLAFIVNPATDEIIDVGCTHTISVTEQFIRNMFLGKYMRVPDIQAIENEIKIRYHGSSQKAIIVSYKDALKKYQEVKTKYYNE